MQEVAEAALRAVEVRAPRVEHTEVMTQRTSQAVRAKDSHSLGGFFYFTGIAYWNAWDSA